MNPPGWDPAWLQRSALRLQEPGVWRGVETQYASASRELVDSFHEHDVLEALLDASKPPLPQASGRKHFLLFTPFRYTPQHPSRFRGLGQRGVWYGARQLKAACAEVAYWRQRFVLDSAGLAGKQVRSNHTFFQATIDGPGIDLTAPPWSALAPVWTSSHDYTQTQRLAAAAADAGLQVIQYGSVRDRGSTCFAVLSVEALREPRKGLDSTRQRWSCIVTGERVEMIQDDGPSRFAWEA